AADSAPVVKLVRADTIRPKAVRWWWNGWLAFGKLHMLAGPPGTGKTNIAIAMAATITTGGHWPDGTRATNGDVVIWSGEDDADDTLVPRLIANGANMARVQIVSGVTQGNDQRPFDPALDMPGLMLTLSRLSEPPALLIVDPIVSAVTADSN